MNEPLGMGGRQPGRGLHRDSQNLDDRQRSRRHRVGVARDGPADIRHDEIGEPIGIRDAVDFDHVVVNDRSGRLCFTRETLSVPFRCCQDAAQEP